MSYDCYVFLYDERIEAHPSGNAFAGY